ncbi:MAG: NAD-dependent epimerase/dehydratase family protein [Candidatus Goldbacteria bacterium]|nr:NAD-dependent epimerase/dehydratase family protein [Candidatus Goldiibacteriota bacterium]
MPYPLEVKILSLKNTLHGKTILVTGGAGFIGSHLVDKLKENNKIIIYDNFYRDSLKFTNFTYEKNIKVVRGDVLNRSLLTKILKEVDIVFHMAAIAGINTITKSPITTMKVNLIGTYNILEGLNEGHIERVILASTSEVYGPYAYLGKEDGPTTQGSVKEPRWSYAVSKLAAEHFVHSYFLEKGLPSTIIRYFNIYGPRQTGESAIHKFISSAIKNEPLVIYGDGLQIRAWCFVDDAIEGTILSAIKEEAIGHVINIGNPKTAITIASLAEKIVETLGSNSNIIYVRKNFPDVELRVPDISLAKSLLGYEPRVGLTEGIKKTAEFYKYNLASLL